MEWIVPASVLRRLAQQQWPDYSWLCNNVSNAIAVV